MSGQGSEESSQPQEGQVNLLDLLASRGEPSEIVVAGKNKGHS